MSFNQGREWKALISKYMRAIPPSGAVWCIAEQIMPDMPSLSNDASTAIIAKIGVAARHNLSAATRVAVRQLRSSACIGLAGREVVKISDMALCLNGYRFPDHPNSRR